MKLKLKDLPKLLKETFVNWNDKDPFRESAIIAYYAIFSIPGLLMLIIAITGYFFGQDKVSQNIMNQISITMGADTAIQIQNMLVKSKASESTFLGSLFGFVILLVGATGVFVELQKTLNLIWQVKVVPQRGLLPILKARLFSFGLILAIAFLLIVSLVISTAIAAFSELIQIDTSENFLVVVTILNFLFSFLVISTLFALMFKILPDAKVKWKHVWLGAIVTGLLFTIGKAALAFYFGKADPASIYGVAGSIILILLWVSYSSMILFFGAEFTMTYTKMYLHKVSPSALTKSEIQTK
jgi:membrane protein